MPGEPEDTYKAKLMRRTLAPHWAADLESNLGKLLAVIAASDNDLGGLFADDPLPED